jgi:outer membrane protein assembly factor BamD
MRKNICVFIAFLLSAAALTGCGGVNQLIKSKDYGMMYKRALEYFQKGKYQKTISLMQEAAPYYTGTVQEDTVLYYWGLSHFREGEVSSSEIIFERFKTHFGRSPFLEDVEYMYAMGFYNMSPDSNRDQAETVRAISAINEYLHRYPNSIRKQLCLVRIDEMKAKLYDKSLLNARTYFKIGRYRSAVVALRNALSEYPDTPHREEILYLTAKSCYELAYNSVSTLQRDRYLDMVDSYYTFVAEFPDSRYRREMDRMQASARKYLDEHPSDVTDPGEDTRRQPNPEMLKQM